MRERGTHVGKMRLADSSKDAGGRAAFRRGKQRIFDGGDAPVEVAGTNCGSWDTIECIAIDAVAFVRVTRQYARVGIPECIS